MISKFNYLFYFCLSIVICFSSNKAKAGDTITLTQLYNFSIGDTFDYRIVYSGHDISNQFPPSYSLTFTRYRIQKVYRSADSLTQFVVRKQLYPPLFTLDTLSYYLHGNTIVVDSSFLYFGRETYYSSSYQGYYTIGQLSAPGLGAVVLTQIGGTGVGGVFNDSTILIYYSGILGRWGTPYRSFTIGLENVIDESIEVYPNPSSNRFYFNGLQSGCSIVIFDELGENLFNVSLDQDKNTVDLTGKPKGIYFYRIMSREGNVLKNGKLSLN